MDIEITRNIKLSLISINPYQSRLNFDEERIEQLSKSILDRGLQYPITVVKDDDKYILVDGERRYRAFNHLQEQGFKEYVNIPSLVKNIKDGESIEDFLIINSLIANEQREDLSILEKAMFYAKLIGRDKKYKTNREFATVINKNETDISKMLKIARSSFHEDILKLSKSSTKGNIKLFENLSKLTDKKMQLKLYKEYIESKIDLKGLIEICSSDKKKVVKRPKLPNFIESRYAKKYNVLTNEKRVALKQEIDTILKKFLG